MHVWLDSCMQLYGRFLKLGLPLNHPNHISHQSGTLPAQATGLEDLSCGKAVVWLHLSESLGVPSLVCWYFHVNPAVMSYFHKPTSAATINRTNTIHINKCLWGSCNPALLEQVTCEYIVHRPILVVKNWGWSSTYTTKIYQQNPIWVLRGWDPQTLHNYSKHWELGYSMSTSEIIPRQPTPAAWTLSLSAKTNQQT